jgi:hypothetical protein
MLTVTKDRRGQVLHLLYPLERLGSVEGRRDLSPGWSGDFAINPGHILWEVQEAYQPPVVTGAVTRGPLEHAAVWKTAQRMTDCGFGREGLSRRIAFYKCVSLVLGTNIVRRELGLAEARVRIADSRYAFAAVPGR